MINATHIRSGHTGEIQQTDQFVDANGNTRTQFYFEDHQRPTVAGWYYSRDLVIDQDGDLCEGCSAVPIDITQGNLCDSCTFESGVSARTLYDNA